MTQCLVQWKLLVDFPHSTASDILSLSRCPTPLHVERKANWLSLALLNPEKSLEVHFNYAFGAELASPAVVRVRLPHRAALSEPICCRTGSACLGHDSISLRFKYSSALSAISVGQYLLGISISTTDSSQQMLTLILSGVQYSLFLCITSLFKSPQHPIDGR